MLIIFSLIGIVLIVIGVIVGVISDYQEDNPLTYIGYIAGCVIFTISIGILLFGIFDLTTVNATQRKIDMYQEENAKIENSVTAIVENYLGYEKGIFEDLSNQSIEILVTIYPEIKANELVKTQLTIFTENNAKIKELKEELLDIDVWRWWVYFGKGEQQ